VTTATQAAMHNAQEPRWRGAVFAERRSVMDFQYFFSRAERFPAARAAHR